MEQLAEGFIDHEAAPLKKGDKSEKASITFVRCEPRRE
jgi:hypothetical protein